MSGRKERVLFVCYANIHRSVTAEELYRNDPRYEVRSAGIASHAKRQLSEEDLAWADRIFVMSRAVLQQLRDESHGTLQSLFGRDFEVLGIPDQYDTFKPEKKAALVKVLREKLGPYLGEPQTGA